MNKNKVDYKNTFSQIHPSDESVERVMDMTKNKKNKRIRFAPAIAAVACIAIIIGGVIGNGAVSARINPVKHTVTQSGTSDILSKVTDANVLIAYAGENAVEMKPLKLNTATPLKIKFRITDIRGKSEEEIEDVVEKHRYEVKTVADSNFEGQESMHHKIERLENIVFSNTIFDYFAIEVKDPKTVESIEMKCNTDYWQLTYKNSSDELSESFTHGTDLKVDGDELVKIMKKYENNGLFEINLDHSMDLCHTIDLNPDVDLSAFDSTLTFVVNYKDGTKAQSIINIGFDKDGNFIVTAVEQ